MPEPCQCYTCDKTHPAQCGTHLRCVRLAYALPLPTLVALAYCSFIVPLLIDEQLIGFKPPNNRFPDGGFASAAKSIKTLSGLCPVDQTGNFPLTLQLSVLKSLFVNSFHKSTKAHVNPCIVASVKVSKENRWLTKSVDRNENVSTVFWIVIATVNEMNFNARFFHLKAR
jgi:hypothetical protein